METLIQTILQIHLMTGSVSAQMANESNLYAGEPWAVKTRNGGGSGLCGSVFSKFPVQLSCCVSSGFTDFRSTFENFMSLVSVLRQIFQAIRDDTKIFPGDLQCVQTIRMYCQYIRMVFVIDKCTVQK